MSTSNRQSGMGPAGYATIFIVILYLGFEVYGLERARERMEPAAVYAEYVGAHRAAALCDPEPPTRATFERNFAAVTERARWDLIAQSQKTDDSPDRRDSAVEATLRTMRRTRESEIDTVIAADGCDSKQAWRLLKLYEIRSRLNLRPSGGGAAASIN